MDSCRKLPDGTVLLKASGAKMTDCCGNVLKVGQNVLDDIFGVGTVRGTVPVEKGDGFNVVFEAADGKRHSRGSEHLTLQRVNNTFHTGEEYESGEVHRRQGVNDADVMRLNEGKEEETPAPQSPPPALTAAQARPRRAASL